MPAEATEEPDDDRGSIQQLTDHPAADAPETRPSADEMAPAPAHELRRREYIRPDYQTAAFRRAIAFGSLIALILYIALYLYAHPAH